MSETSYIFKIEDVRIEYNLEKHFNGLEVELQATITGYSGSKSLIRIPAFIINDEKEYPVRTIGKKAFLGNRVLREIVLPETITSIDSWAFAQCDNLAKIVILRNDAGECMPKLGKGVFEDCRGLEHICVGKDKENSFSALLGTLPVLLQADYLLTDDIAGEEEWFAKWDRKLVEFLNENDKKGYTNLVLCGEEDIQRSEPEYISEKRKLKSKLCLIRLMFDHYLKEEREVFVDYLNSHTKGCESDEAWKVILEEYSDDISYYKLFDEIGAIKTDCIDEMIKDMGDRHIEAKAYLLGLKGYASQSDVFDRFIL